MVGATYGTIHGQVNCVCIQPTVNEEVVFFLKVAENT